MKGYIRTLEVLLSLSLIVLTMVFIFRFPPLATTDEMNTIKYRAYNSLEYLDEKGYLRKIVLNVDRNALDKNLTVLLSGLDFDADICIDSCFTPILPSKQVATVEYYISGYKDFYNKAKVKVWVWRKF